MTRLLCALTISTLLLGSPAAARAQAVQGALVGAAGMAALSAAEIRACGTGCDYGPGTIARDAMLAGIGGVAGAAVGWLARGDVEAFWRVGPTAAGASVLSSALGGATIAPGAALVIQSKYVSLRSEYTRIDHRFAPPAGAVPAEILTNLVPPTSRVAGATRAVGDRRVSFVFSELAGVRASLRERVRLELLAGLGVVGQESFDYYDAYRQTSDGSVASPSRSEPIPGKYYVLNFESPRMTLVVGAELEVSVSRRIAVTPMIRYHALAKTGATLMAGAGVHWRF